MSEQSNTLFVGNLPWALRGKDLIEIFSQYGEVTFARVILDRETKKSKGYGFVEFANAEDASKAKEEMHEAEINDRSIKIDYARPREENNNQ
ncbi:RNA recognition motif domain-containing protein [Candidatus Vampirococcus lugosii]|uniref:RNA-binding protein, containing RNA recognition motif (RRM) domain n=1 Tax=Candidatus Vampirococcus lugosii TaxID=2789015 RepID=A0ABS5QM66_9BACT|nr:RNA-binding protein [Candidatus Vampirococcus lugosii]MBS8121806.1 RNA-binding protein, containing RNA recognition motif (RRM) domain [Candidatus Vampirococcus lugosii]